MGKIKGLGLMLIGAAGGAALSHYLDPDRGRARRARAADQLDAALNSGVDEFTSQVDYAAGQAKGAVAERVDVPSAGADDFDVYTLKHKVESEVLGPAGVASGEVIVDVTEDKIVSLRGPVGSQETMDNIVQRTRELDGVAGVSNLMHLPGDPAPNIEEPLRASEEAAADVDAGSGSG